MTIRPFKIDFSDDEVARLKRKLQDTRLPTEEIVPNAGDDYGEAFSLSLAEPYCTCTNQDA